MSDGRKTVKAPAPGKKAKDFGFVGTVTDVLYNIFIKNWRKKLLAIFSAIVVLFYAYGVILANANKRSVTIHDVHVEITLDDSEEFILGKNDQKVNIIGSIPRQTQDDNINLNPEKYVVRVNVSDDDVRRGSVKISTSNVIVPSYNGSDFSFEPVMFLDKNNSKHLQLDIPIRGYVKLESKTVDVAVAVDKEGFSGDFSYNDKMTKAAERITVRAPEDILKKLKISTEEIPLNNRVHSFKTNAKFHVTFDGKQCDYNFSYDDKRKILSWKGEDVIVSQKDVDGRVLEVSVKIERYETKTVSIAVDGVMLAPSASQNQSDLLNRLEKIDLDEMRKNRLEVEVKVAKKDLEQWNKDKDNLIQAWFDFSEIEKENECRVNCILLNTNMDVKIVDYSPKKVMVSSKVKVSSK